MSDDLSYCNMNFDKGIKKLHQLLKKYQPQTFDSSWILKHNSALYTFIRTNIRNEVGDEDWDSVTKALPRKFQKLWQFHPKTRRKFGESYSNPVEVQIILKKYRSKLYTFLALSDENDKYIREAISIAFVRIAQKGNLQARRKLIKLLRYTVDEWIENSPRLRSWCGYGDYVNEKIESCIRCYHCYGSCDSFSC
jgi:hypothetical protein